ncbi:Uncharacterised protein [Mycobacteroides abscessus subsp. abscessus]|nr:Uncharacterised protein [Mycobacteroides abscessus subsp. abscessus]
MRARRLDLLGFGHVAVKQCALQAVAACPIGRDLGVMSERNIELFAVLGAITGHATRRQVVVTIGFVADGTESAAS